MGIWYNLSLISYLIFYQKTKHKIIKYTSQNNINCLVKKRNSAFYIVFDSQLWESNKKFARKKYWIVYEILFIRGDN